jgi:hypothetical protein
VVLADHLLRDGVGRARIRRVVADDVLDLLTGDLGGEEIERAFVADTHRGGRPADGEDGADLDLRLG